MEEGNEMDERIYNALEDARKQGLPLDWTLTIDDKGKKRWTGPGPDAKSFVYLQRALEYVNGAAKRSKKRGASSVSSMDENDSVSSMKGASKKQKRKKAKSSAGGNTKDKTAAGDVESDPETALDIPDDFDPEKPPKHNRLCGTVHWDPDSPEGQKVGHRIRVWSSTTNSWKQGRIVRYDPVSHKHKIVFFQDKNIKADYEAWLYLDQENIQLGGRFVWALVKGFAWWPAQVLHCSYPKPIKIESVSQPKRAGYELVEFFATNEVANIKVGPETLRPFNGGAVDDVILQNKKKRNPEAIEDAKNEEDIVNEVKNDAARFYAEKAFDILNSIGSFLLGAKVEVFRGDLNYPNGEHLIGTVRLYSPTTKKHLVSYDMPPINKYLYEATWLNLGTVRYKVLDETKGQKRKNYSPSGEDLYPFLFGHTSTFVSLQNKCRGCVGLCDDIGDDILICSNCNGKHHPGCLDPPLTKKAAKTIIQSGENWKCKRCIKCIGCREFEIAQGTETVNSPPSLFLPKNESLNLCVSCIPLYDKKQFCPICAHVWDDVRYNKIQNRIKKSLKQKKINANEEAENGEYIEAAENENSGPTDESDNTDINETSDNNFRWKDPLSIDQSYFYPEKNVWGYNESIMLCCEKCNIWVHAGCAELSKMEYDLTTQGIHPIYSQEYLCRTCCREKALSIMKQLMAEDSMYLFASPVTDQVAHNYRDIIKEPMDLQTMSERAYKGEYKNYAWIREAFELMVDNALVFNPPQSTYWLEAKRFYNACMKRVFKWNAKGAPESKYGLSIQERFQLAEKLIKAEKDRVKADETAEKKDLVAGSDVLVIELGPLVKPPDPPSCIPTAIGRLNKIDAFYSAWMDCCFSCGSSGASDTMLFCVDCGEAYHSFCASAPIHSMNPAAVSGWRCPNCKLCEISGEATEDETKLLYCEMCDRAFSMNLLSPPLEKVPFGIWVCGQCVDCSTCGNRCDNGEVSRNFWSRSPSKCLPCGGCKGLSLPSLTNAECRVCHTISRKIDGMPQCSSCKSFIHPACDPSYRDIEPSLYRCPSCISGFANTESSSDVKVEYTIPSTELSTTDRREEELRIAMREAKKRGLPDGWKVFYGNSNRKKWKSPNPNSKIFDSIPKALEYVRKMRMTNKQSFEGQSSSNELKEEGFNYVPFALDAEPEWIKRHVYHDESTSLMGDAEVLLHILEKRLGSELPILFDEERVYHQKSPTRLQSIPIWELHRAARFVRFVKRLRIISQTTKPKARDEEETRNAQRVVCKMASAFMHSVCVMFQIDVSEMIKCSEKLQSLLVPPVSSGIVDYERTSYMDDESLEFGGRTLEDIAYLQLKAAEELNAPIHELVVQANAVSAEAVSESEDQDVIDPFTERPFSIDNDQTMSSSKAKVTSEHVCHKTENNQSFMNGDKTSERDDTIFAMKTEKELDIADALIMLNRSPSRMTSSSVVENKPGEEINNKINVTVKDQLEIGMDDEKKVECETLDHITQTESTSVQGNTASYHQDHVDNKSQHALTDTSVIEDSLSGLLQLRNTKNSTNDAKEDRVQNEVVIDHVTSHQKKTDDSRLPTIPSETVHHQEFSKLTTTTPNAKINLPWMSKSFLIPEPMKGWQFASEEYSQRKWIDSRTCSLCGISGDSDICIDTPASTDIKHLGRLLPLPGGEWIHSGCAVWSSEVWEDPVGGKLNGVLKAKSRGAKLRCFGCGHNGATIGCHRSNCPENYHFPCAKLCGVIFTESHKVYCKTHKDSAKDKVIETFDEPMKILRVVDEKVDFEPDLCYRSGALVVHSLGKIQVDCDGFHSKEYITPPGFCSSRIFWSYVKPKTRTLYLMQILRSEDQKPLFQLRAADAPYEYFQNSDVNKLYEEVMVKVWETNKEFFSHNDLFSVYPIVRSKKNKKGFCLNGPQFFGYGVDFIREALEKQEDAIACAAPLSKDSVTYKFCFHKPTEQEAMDLQRQRAVIKAEKALENASGCARTEGSGAFDKSKGSGRITRALVSTSSEGQKKQRPGALTKGGTDTALTKGTSSGLESERDLASTQAMYDEMKSVPMEERLEAKRSHIHGWGLFAKKDYPKNSMIAEYMGEAIGQPIADKREKMYEISGEGSCYMFRLDLHEIVDATKVGCMARFMNHCCDANAYAKIITVTTDQGTEKKIVVFANQDIPSGGEITYDYKFPVEDGSLRCTCGAPNCIGRMN